MNDKPDTLAERDDAAFRARLAPLASEVLPPARPADNPNAAPPARRTVLVLAIIVVIVAVLIVAASRSRWPLLAAPGNAPAVQQTSPVQNAPDPMIGLLMQRGNAALTDGDVMGARLLFERAAAMGSAGAATSAGKTYDNEFLLRSGARGIRADQDAAIVWYRRAAALGDPEARTRLARIDASSRP